MEENIAIRFEALNTFYGAFHALKGYRAFGPQR